VTVGHQVMLHGCTIGDGTLIGIQAVVLNNSVVGKDCLVGAGAVLTENKNFPDRSVIFGAPAKAVREVTEDNLMRMRVSAADYVRRGIQYKKELKRIG
jgi:carbonic anhydrase/acetyltransferase-like protein (isoleucine patch superfamily)